MSRNRLRNNNAFIPRNMLIFGHWVKKLSVFFWRPTFHYPVHSSSLMDRVLNPLINLRPHHTCIKYILMLCLGLSSDLSCSGFPIKIWGTALQARMSRFHFPRGVTGIFHLLSPSCHTMALGLTQPLTDVNTRDISWGQFGRCVGLKPYHFHMPIV